MNGSSEGELEEIQRQRNLTFPPDLVALLRKRCEAGNPMFSVHQSDVIYYGANLQDWLRRESRKF